MDGLPSEQVAAPAPGTAEYNAAMAAKVDESAAKAAADAAGELALQDAPQGDKKDAPQGDKKDAPAEEPAKAPEDEQEDAPKDDAQKAAEAAGVNVDALQSEYDEKGELSAESYEKLAKAGFPKEVVDSYIAGQQALAEQFEAKGFEAAGGKEQFAAMADWAKTSLSPAELKAYNDAIEGSQEEMLQAVRGLRARYEGEYGKQPRLMGGKGASSASQGYASRAEMTADMRDPRYAKDPAFRSKVTAKIAATTAF